MANYFVYDKDAFQAAIKEYDAAIEEFNTLKNDTKTSIGELKERGWNSKAGQEFFSKYSDDWEPVLDDYVELLDYLKHCLTDGQTLFDPIVEKAQTLKFEK